MKRKISQPYVKADLTPELDTAMKIITEKLGTRKSHIVTSALKYFFQQIHPEALPKSNQEIFMKAKEEYLYNRTLRHYTRGLVGVDAILGYEDEILEYEHEIKEMSQKLEDKKRNVKTTRNKDIKNSLKIEIEDLEESLDMKKNELEQTRGWLKNASSHHIKP